MREREKREERELEFFFSSTSARITLEPTLFDSIVVEMDSFASFDASAAHAARHAALLRAAESESETTGTSSSGSSSESEGEREEQATKAAWLAVATTISEQRKP